MRVEIVPFRAADYAEAVREHPWLAPLECGRRHEGSGPAFSMRIDGALAGCAGLALLWPGVAEAWAVLTLVGRAHPLTIHRAVVDHLNHLVAAHRLHRVQADVMDEFKAGRRWVTALGMVEEGTMRSYGPNRETFVRYAWVRS